MFNCLCYLIDNVDFSLLFGYLVCHGVIINSKILYVYLTFYFLHLQATQNFEKNCLCAEVLCVSAIALDIILNLKLFGRSAVCLSISIYFYICFLFFFFSFWVLEMQ